MTLNALADWVFIASMAVAVPVMCAGLARLNHIYVELRKSNAAAAELKDAVIEATEIIDRIEDSVDDGFGLSRR